MSLSQKLLSEGGVDLREDTRRNLSSQRETDLDHQPCAGHPKREVLGGSQSCSFVNGNSSGLRSLFPPDQFLLNFRATLRS